MSRRTPPIYSVQSLTPRPSPTRNKGEVIVYCTTLLLIVADTGLLLYDLGRAITVLV